MGKRNLFSKGELTAAISLIIIILAAFLFYYLYENKVAPSLDIAQFSQEIAMFESEQLRLSDSIQNERDKRQEYYQNRYQRGYKKKTWERKKYYARSDTVKAFHDNVAFTSEKKEAVRHYEIVKVDLNHCDTSDITKVPQFGQKRAAKIVEYRGQLGGFASLEQLTEIYILQHVNLDYVRKYFVVNAADVQKIYVNTATYKELIRHPYFDAYLTKSVLNYRERYGKINSLSEFQKCTNAYQALIDKLEPYLSFE